MYFQGKGSKLKPKLGLLDLLLFGMGNILGPQLFLMLGGLVAISGVHGLIVLLACLIISLLIASNYLEVALSMPMVGVVVNSVNDAYGEFFSFVVGWSQLLSNMIFAVVCAMGFGYFVGFPMIGAFFILVIITLLQLRGIEDIGRLDKKLVLLLLGFFFTIALWNAPSLLNFNFTSITIDIGSAQKVLFGVGFFFLAFTNFEDLVTYVEEMKDFRKLPRVMFGVIFIIAIAFILLYLMLLNYVGNPLMEADPMTFLSSKLFGSHAKMIVSMIAIIASVTSLIGSLSSSSRNAYSMSERHFLPKRLSILKDGVPRNAILFSSLIIGLMLLIGNVESVIYLANFIYFFITIAVAMTAMKLRKRRVELERPFKMPFFPLIPVLTIVLMLILMYFLDTQAIGLGLLWLYSGFYIYIFRIVGEQRQLTAILGATIIIWFLTAVGSAVLYELKNAVFFSNIYLIMAVQIVLCGFTIHMAVHLRNITIKIAARTKLLRDKKGAR